MWPLSSSRDSRALRRPAAPRSDRPTSRRRQHVRHKEDYCAFRPSVRSWQHTVQRACPEVITGLAPAVHGQRYICALITKAPALVSSIPDFINSAFIPLGDPPFAIPSQTL